MAQDVGLERPGKPELRLWLRLLTCTNLIEGEIRRRLRRDFATTLPRFDLLSQLDRHPSGLTLTELSNHMMVSNGNLTGLVDRLVSDGLVERQADPDDRRSTRVVLTRAGKADFDTMTPAHENWVGGMLDGLDEKDVRQLHDLLGKLRVSAAEATP